MLYFLITLCALYLSSFVSLYLNKAVIRNIYSINIVYTKILNFAFNIMYTITFFLISIYAKVAVICYNVTHLPVKQENVQLQAKEIVVTSKEVVVTRIGNSRRE